MKKILTNIFATTGLSLVLLTIMALIFKAEWLLLVTIFQVLALNLLIHFSLLLRQKWEFQYYLTGALVDLAIIEILVFAVSKPFDWNAEVWVLILIGFLTYLISNLLDLFYLNQEACEINHLINRRQKPGKDFYDKK